MDGHLQIEVLDGRFLYLVADGGPRRVHQHVGLAEPVDCCRHCCHPLAFLRHVEMDVERLTPLGADLCRRLLADLGP